MIHFRGQYTQKGYGLGGLFQSLPKIMVPLATKLISLVKKPEVKHFLKSTSREATNLGSKILLNAVKKRVLNRPNVENDLTRSKQELERSISKGVSSLRNRKYSHKKYIKRKRTRSRTLRKKNIKKRKKYIRSYSF